MIDQFFGEYRWLSNFWPCWVALGDGWGYNTVENAYQAAKFPRAMRGRFTTCSPGEAKREGRKVALPEGWNELRLVVMEDLLRQKFSRASSLSGKLLDTGDHELVEGNTWGDVFWGADLRTGRGENQLGKLLMRIRGDLRARV